MALVAVVGCTGGEDSGGADDPVESSITTTTLTTSPPTQPPTTAASATSITTSTTSTTGTTTTATSATAPWSSTSTTATQAPTTTEGSGGVDGLVLRTDGIGPVTFGTSKAETLAVLTAELGADTPDSSNMYPIDRGDGMYFDDTSGEVFTHSAQHTTCFDNALCVVFGGDSADSLTLVGWVQSIEGVDVPLATFDGVTVGSNWADHLEHLDVRETGCYSIGYGTTRGVNVVLSSAGDPFLAYDAAGNEIPTEPDPRDVTVIELSAGPRPGNPEEQDC